MRRAYASHASPPAGPVPPRNTWPRHATETHRAHQWEIDRLVDAGGRRESRARPLFPVSIRYTQDGMGIWVKILNHHWTYLLSFSPAWLRKNGATQLEPQHCWMLTSTCTKSWLFTINRTTSHTKQVWHNTRVVVWNLYCDRNNDRHIHIMRWKPEKF